MLNAIQTKLLLVIAALLSSLVGYAAYQHNQQLEREKQVKELFREMRPDEQAAQPKGWAEALKKH